MMLFNRVISLLSQQCMKYQINGNIINITLIFIEIDVYKTMDVFINTLHKEDYDLIDI